MTNFWRSKRVLVGGGCGFLGSYLVPQLIDAGGIVTVVDNLENGYVENLAPVRQHVRFVRDDLREREVCEHVTMGQDVVLNLAAKAYGMDYSRTHNGEMLVDNLLATLTPLDAACRNKVRHYLIASSSCVYPDDAPAPTPELPVFTGQPEQVNEGYGWAKRIQELAGTYYARDHGMKITIVRPFNPYGGNYRWTSPDKAHVIPALVKRILDGEDPVRVWGSGKQRRNLLHASDATRLILKAVESPLNAIPINIGYDDDITIEELVHLICDMADVHPKIEFDTTKPEGRFRKCADATRLREIAGDTAPQVSLRDGIAEMIAWYHRSFGAQSEAQALTLQT
jgi:nucleoside-diphosphate-sugar epimerase